MPDIKTEFSRTYALVNPNPAAGPPTWVLASLTRLALVVEAASVQLHLQRGDAN